MSEQEKIYKSSRLNTSKENEKSRSIHSNTKETYNMSVIQAKLDFGMLSSIDVMQLQRTIGNRATMQLLKNYNNTSSIQKKKDKNNINKVDDFDNQVVQKKENNTGLPDNLKVGIESLSGMSMDDVRVHDNSDKPAQIGALAYTQGTDIHVAPGQEKHLPHEAWHVVQQAQGRVKPTMQMKGGVNVNDDRSLEKEADVMGSKAVNLYSQVEKTKGNKSKVFASSISQRKSNIRQDFGFVDNQPEVVAQKEKQIMINKGDRTKRTSQLKRGNISIPAKLTVTTSQNVYQLVKVGKENITTVTDLAQRLGLAEDVVIATFNQKMLNFPHADEATINNYLKGKTNKVRGGDTTKPLEYMGLLANIYRISYMKKVGEQNNITDLASRLGITENEVITTFNEEMGNFPHANKATINNYLKGKKNKVKDDDKCIGPVQYIELLAEYYKRNYIKLEGGDFLKNMWNIESKEAYKTLVSSKPGDINYLEGKDDGVSIGDEYNESLACTLYALLELRPKFLGATSPKELHYIFRSKTETKEYDKDEFVAKIRLSAGLTYRKPNNDEITVRKFIEKLSLSVGNRRKKIIIDPKGQAHTFVLEYIGNQWKQVDNDSPLGIKPAPTTFGTEIRVIWE